MNRLKWITTSGGSLILIDENSIKYWSGILKSNLYQQGQMEVAEDFMDSEETDYGKACLVEGYLGVVEAAKGKALVLGDEPLLTTSFVSFDQKKALVRWCYGEDELFVSEHLQMLDFRNINNWQDPISYKISNRVQYLFDSALCYEDLKRANEDFLYLDFIESEYIVWTSIYEPNDGTKLIIHKFETVKRVAE